MLIHKSGCTFAEIILNTISVSIWLNNLAWFKKKLPAWKCKWQTFTKRYTDDQTFYMYIYSKGIYPPSLDLKETKNPPDGTSYLDLY